MKKKFLSILTLITLSAPYISTNAFNDPMPKENKPTNQLIKQNQDNVTILDDLAYAEIVKSELGMKLKSLKERFISSRFDPENALLEIDRIEDTMRTMDIHTQQAVHMPNNVRLKVTRILKKYADKLNDLKDNVIPSKKRIAEKTLNNITKNCKDVMEIFESGFTHTTKLSFDQIRNEFDKNVEILTRDDKYKIKEKLIDLIVKLRESDKIFENEKKDVDLILYDLIKEIEREETLSYIFENYNTVTIYFEDNDMFLSNIRIDLIETGLIRYMEILTSDDKNKIKEKLIDLIKKLKENKKIDENDKKETETKLNNLIEKIKENEEIDKKHKEDIETTSNNSIEKLEEKEIINNITEKCKDAMEEVFENGLTLGAKLSLFIIKGDLDENMENLTSDDKNKIKEKLINLIKKLEENNKINENDKESVKFIINDLIEKLKENEEIGEEHKEDIETTSNNSIEKLEEKEILNNITENCKYAMEVFDSGFTFTAKLSLYQIRNDLDKNMENLTSDDKNKIKEKLIDLIKKLEENDKIDESEKKNVKVIINDLIEKL